jgi:hypothetical protein
MNAPHPQWCARLLSEFSAADARAIALVKDLSFAQLNWKPAPDKWSVGLCIEHLCITNEVYGPPIAAALVTAPSSAVPEITPGWFARWFIRSYIAPSTKTAKAPPKIAPTSSTVDLAILDRFLGTNRDARQLVERAAPYDVNRLRFKNPFIPLLRFTVGTGFEILSKHEQRHLLQAERVLSAPGFPR